LQQKGQLFQFKGGGFFFPIYALKWPAYEGKLLFRLDFFKKSNFEDFRGISSPFREKTTSPMKKISGQEMLKIMQKTHFFFVLRSW
jgi:hypothetical protein